MTRSFHGAGVSRGSRHYRGFASILVAIAMTGGQAAAQIPPSRLESIDVYRTAQLDPRALERRYEPAIRALVDAMTANDEATMDRVHREIIDSIWTSGDFAYVDLDLTIQPDPDENAVFATIELVDRADASARLSFDAAPTGSVADPDGVLEAWDEYQREAFELIQARQIEPRFDHCPAFHCIVGFDHEALAPYLERFDRAARGHHAELVRVLREDADESKRGNAAFVLAHAKDASQLVRDLVPSLDDPAALVRNNALRVLWMTALKDKSVEIPFEPLARRLDDPDGGCRNKAALLMSALADRPEYRQFILGIGPAVLRLLRLEKPNTHDPAYQILRTVSGADFGERDYARWAAWLEATRQDGP
jgi:hypothetical protein